MESESETSPFDFSYGVAVEKKLASLYLSEVEEQDEE